MGDAYTFVGFERHTKLVLAWHLGRCTSKDTNLFMAKLATAAVPEKDSDTYLLTTDGWGSYPAAVEQYLGAQVTYAQLVKTYSGEGLDSERRVRPP